MNIRRALFAPSMLVLALVTATVTGAQPAGTFQVQITNNADGAKFVWTQKVYPDQFRCDAALGNLPAIMRSVANPDPADVPAEPKDTDPELTHDVLALATALIMRTGKVPNLSLSCELPGDPA